MASIFDKAFLAATAERAISTAAESAIGVLTGQAVSVIDWTQAGIIVGTATLLSVLKSIAANTGKNPGPSIGGVEQLGTKIG